MLEVDTMPCRIQGGKNTHTESRRFEHGLAWFSMFEMMVDAGVPIQLPFFLADLYVVDKSESNRASKAS